MCDPSFELSTLPPSKRVADPKLSMPFLNYLGWYVERYKSWANHSSLSFVINQVREDGKLLESAEKNNFARKVSHETFDNNVPWPEELRNAAYTDVQPMAVEETILFPKKEDVQPEIDFKEDFGPLNDS